MNYKSMLLIAVLAVMMTVICQTSLHAASVKERLQQAERDRDRPLLKGLCASADPKDLNIADAIDEETALLMLERGADVNKRCEVCMNEWPNDGESTPLHAAAKWNSTRLIDALLKKGANVDARGRMDKDTPLHLAAYDGNAEAVERLLKGGANPNLECAYGNALTCAVFSQLQGYPRDNARNQRYLKAMKLLVSAGADVHGALNNGESITDMVMKNENPEFMQQARLILGLAKPSDKPTDLTDQQQVANVLTNTDLKTLPSLAPLLKNSDPDVRARALGLITDLAAKTDENETQLPKDITSTMVLMTEGSARASTTLLDRKLLSPQLMSAIIAATNDPQPTVRTQAIRVLRIIKPIDGDIIKAVTSKLYSDTDSKVRLCAAVTLGCFATIQRPDASPEIEKSIQTAITHDGDAAVRIGAAMILNFLHQGREGSPSTNPKPEASKPTILAMEFGRALGFEAIQMRDARSIPCYNHDNRQAAYRVCIVLDSRQKEPHMKLRLTVPEKRSDWSFEHYLLVPGFDPTYVRASDGTWSYRSVGSVKVSADGKIGTYDDSFSQGACGMYGMYAATWPVDKETKPGKYKLEVFINDELAKTYDFELVPSK